MTNFVLWINQAIETSPIWSVLFALGFIAFASGFCIYLWWYKTNTKKQDSLYFRMTMVGLAVTIGSAIAILRSISPSH